MKVIQIDYDTETVQIELTAEEAYLVGKAVQKQFFKEIYRVEKEPGYITAGVAAVEDAGSLYPLLQVSEQMASGDSGIIKNPMQHNPTSTE